MRIFMLVLTLYSLPLHAAGPSPLSHLSGLLGTLNSLFSGELVYLVRPDAETIHGLSEDFAHLIAWRSLSAQQPLGAGNFDVGLSLETTRLAHADLWQQATGEAFRQVSLPRIHARVGLPGAINLGVSYYRNPSSDVGVQGFEVTRQFLPEVANLPALSLGVSGTRIIGVTGLEFRTQAASLTVSRGYGGVTPYTGLGYVRATGHYSGSRTLPFDMQAAFWRGFVGVEARYGMLTLAGEIGTKSGARDAGMRVAIGF